MTEELLRKSLSRCPLFGGLSRETLDSLTGDDRAVRTYTDGEIIGSTDESGLPLLIVLAEAALLLFLAQGAGILMIDDCVFDWKNLLLTAGFFLALAAVNILFSVLQYRKIAGGKQQ